MNIEWTQHGECASYGEVPVGAQITRVNGRESLGICENCGWPVLDGNKYYRYADGIIVHAHCLRRRGEKGR